MQPLAEVGIARCVQLSAVFAAHTLDGRVRREARAHAVFELGFPTRVGRQHQEGFQHFARHAGDAAGIAVEHVAQRAAHLRERRVEALFLLQGIVGDDAAKRGVRFMQDRGADGDAVGECAPLDKIGPARPRFDLRQPRKIAEHAGGDHLRQHHGDSL
jgi:hypothetical protein